MSAFNNCILSAQKQGEISEEQAESLMARYAEHLRARAAAGDRDPEGAAKAAMASEMDQEAAIKQAIANGQIAAQNRIRAFAEGYRNLNGNSSAFEAFAALMESQAQGTTSWRYRAEAIARMTQAEVADYLSNFRRSFFSGKRMDKPGIENVVREMRGEATGSPQAKGMADAMEQAFEKLRQKFNEAAGFEAIGKLDYGFLPQHHSPAALLNVPGKTAAEKYAFWRDRELPRLDLDKMRDPLTGGHLTPERLEEVLRASWNRIVTGGWSDREPSAAPFGTGALAKQRSDHRFLHYKTADDWIASDREFGSGDPTKAMFQHIRNMAHDIAAMETFGPNPNATVNWMKQVVQSEVAKSITGEPSLHTGKANEDTGNRLANRLQAIYDAVRGPEIISSRLAAGFADVSNVLTSAYLGATSILAAATDPFIDNAARRLNGLPHWKALTGIVHAMRSAQTREQAVRSGLGMDDFLHIMGNEARYAGTLGGHEVTKWLADRTVTLNGLNAITQARKHRFGIDWQAMAADHAGETWAELGNSNAYFRRSMENYGFTEKDWNNLRKTELHIPAEGSAGYLRPADVKNSDLGVRYLGMILGETERAVPTSTMRSRSIVTSNLQRGTVWGEIINSGLQFKSFALSFTGLQMQAIKMELNQGVAQGAAYAAALFIPLTLGGGMAVQLNNIANGKDLQPMDPTTGQGLKFWLQALFKGGGLGLLGDFIFSDLTRFGATPAEQLSGPTISLASDAMSLTVGTAQKALTGQKTHFGREAVRKVARNVPIISSLPYTRAAYQRLVVDQLQYLTDPDAHKYFREQEKRMLRETGQSYFWRPGETSPERAPEFSQAVK
jgi:hypothetical protein